MMAMMTTNTERTTKALIRAHRDEHARDLRSAYRNKVVITDFRTGSPDVDDIIDIVIMEPNSSSCEAICYFTFDEFSSEEKLIERVTRYGEGLLAANIQPTKIDIQCLGLSAGLKKEYGLPNAHHSDTFPAWTRNSKT